MNGNKSVDFSKKLKNVEILYKKKLTSSSINYSNKPNFNNPKNSSNNPKSMNISSEINNLKLETTNTKENCINKKRKNQGSYLFNSHGIKLNFLKSNNEQFSVYKKNETEISQYALSFRNNIPSKFKKKDQMHNIKHRNLTKSFLLNTKIINTQNYSYSPRKNLKSKI